MRTLRIGLLIIVALFAAGYPARVSARQDAPTLDSLAEILYREDIGNGSQTVWIGGTFGKHPEIIPKYLQVGEPMPEFTLKEFGKVQSVRSAALEAPYVLNVWASWCPPCRDEFPLLARASLAPETPFKIYFVNSGDTQRRASNFLRTQRSGITVLFDPPPAYDFNNIVGLSVFPDSILVGADGRILAIHAGGLSETTLAFFRAALAAPEGASYTPPEVLLPKPPFDPAVAMPLVSGVTYQGVLDDKLPYLLYQFTGEAGAQVSLSMRSQAWVGDDAVDPYLVLVGPDGATVTAHDDDSGALYADAGDRFAVQAAQTASDATITAFTLPESGTYTVIVGRAGYEAGQNAGPYQLTFIDTAAIF